MEKEVLDTSKTPGENNEPIFPMQDCRGEVESEKSGDNGVSSGIATMCVNKEEVKEAQGRVILLLYKKQFN